MSALTLSACQGENTSSNQIAIVDYRTATPAHEETSVSTKLSSTNSAFDGFQWPFVQIPTSPMPSVHAASEGDLAPISEGPVSSTGSDQVNAAPVQTTTSESSGYRDGQDSSNGENDSGESSSASVPWYVPREWVEEYLACTTAPWRFDRTTWIITAGWPRSEAEYVADHEGGWDACQFNTGGSGACGWFQILPCQGLDPSVQIAAATSKWASCGYSFECAWYRWWR